MNLEVTVASKKVENIKELASSIYVISSSDIERSGATNIFELLREVPGYWGVQNEYLNIDAYMRNAYEGSVLVLLDGTPMTDIMYSSFAYDNFEIPLMQIDRIEIIKGSGGTVYGANSASGVISITTKDVNSLSPLYAQGKIANPGYAEAAIGGGKYLSNSVSVSYYGNYKHFNGFDQEYSGFEGSRFTEDDNTTTTYSAGFNAKYRVNDKLNIGTSVHYSGYNSNNYNVYVPVENAYIHGSLDNPMFETEEEIRYSQRNNNHLVANAKADYSFTDNHNLFVRLSTDRQKMDQPSAGGFTTNNSIYDLEIQDNFTLGFNTISTGINYRSVNYDIKDIFYEHSIDYIDKQNTESLSAFFIQDKMSFFNNKLSLIIGAKFENFSLINNDYYFSPMAKMVYMPNNKLTFWGGYSLSYTTPGYNQTNIELSMFKAKSPEGAVFGYLLDQGLEHSFLKSQEGQALIAQVSQMPEFQELAQQFPGYFGISAIGSTNTEPASFKNIEFGFRAQVSEKLYFESNLYFTYLENGVVNSPYGFDYINSPTNPSEVIIPYYYGNYMKGNNWGAETIVKYQPKEGILFEFSHSLFKDKLNFQENEDFSISELSDYRIDFEEYPTVPEHVFRAKTYIDLPKNFRVNLTGLYATAYFNRFSGVESAYETDNERFQPIYDVVSRTNKIGEQDERFILNFRVDKFLYDKKLNLYLYGNDICSSPFVESTNQLVTGYARQIGRLYGFGINYTL